MPHLSLIEEKNPAKLKAYLSVQLNKPAITDGDAQLLLDVLSVAKQTSGVIGARTYLDILRGKSARFKSLPEHGKYAHCTYPVKGLLSICEEVNFSNITESSGTFGPDSCFSKQKPNLAKIADLEAWIRGVQTTLPSGTSLTPVPASYVAPTYDIKKVNKSISSKLEKFTSGFGATLPGTELTGEKWKGTKAKGDSHWLPEVSYFGKQTTSKGSTVSFVFARGEKQVSTSEMEKDVTRVMAVFELSKTGVPTFLECRQQVWELRLGKPTAILPVTPAPLMTSYVNKDLDKLFPSPGLSL
jgi:hypothetical protein